MDCHCPLWAMAKHPMFKFIYSRRTWVQHEQDQLGRKHTSLAKTTTMQAKHTKLQATITKMQADALDGFSCAAAEVRHRYKQKHLRTAFTQLPGAKDSSSTVSSKVKTGPMLEQQDRPRLM